MATVLIVDSHVNNRTQLSTLLTHSSHKVLEATDGRDALQLVQESPIDLAFCNILLPTMDGSEFVSSLRSNPKTAVIPIVFCAAAYHAREARRMAKACGVREILTLPADAEAVLSTLAATLGRAGRSKSVSPAKADLDALRIRNRTLIDKTQELNASNQRLEALMNLIRKLARERDPRVLIDTCCDAAREIVGANYAGAWLFDTPSHGATGFVAKGMDAAHAVQFSAAVPLAQFLRGRLEKARSMRLADLGTAFAAEGGSDHVDSIRLGSALCVRVETPSQNHGFLFWLNKIGSDEFGTQDELLALALAAHLGVCYESACQPGELESLARVLKQEAIDRAASEKKLRESEKRFRQLSTRLLQLQDEERRRIAKELHDSTSQSLAMVAMNLDTLLHAAPKKSVKSSEAERILSDCRALVEQCSSEIRTTSYVLHPPLLEQVGLAGALSDFARGFEQRSGIRATVEAPEAFGRLPRDIEIALLRVVQESLVNIHRHSGSVTAAVRLARSAEHAVLEVEDRGRGMPPGLLENEGAARLGVGILGMRERLKELDGQLEIVSSSSGVIVRATARLK